MEEAKKNNLAPEKVMPRHRALMRLIVTGMSAGKAGEEIGFSPARVSILINSPLFKGEMMKMQADYDKKFLEEVAKREAEKAGSDPVKKVLEEAKEKAAKTFVGALNDDKGGVRLNAASAILDRTGYGKDETLRVLVEPSQGLVDMLARRKKEKDGSAGEDTTSGDKGTASE